MSSLKAVASSFINPIIRSFRHPPTPYLATRIIPKPPQNPIYCPRRFSTNSSDSDYDSDEGSPKYLNILASTSGFASTDESGGKLGMKLKAKYTVEIVDPDLASHISGDLNLENQVDLQEILDRAIQKIVSDGNIPNLIRKKASTLREYKWILESELKDMGVVDEINEVITPRYGLECVWWSRPRDSSWWMSPALIDRLFGAEVTKAMWLEQFDLTCKKVKLQSDAMLNVLDDMKTEHRDVDKTWSAICELGKRANESSSGLSHLEQFEEVIFEDFGDYLEEKEVDEETRKPKMWPRREWEAGFTLAETEVRRIQWGALGHLLERYEFIFKKDLPRKLPCGYFVDSPPPAPTYKG